MTNKEFQELSKKRVKELNGSNKDASFEAWRDGYKYAFDLVYKSLNEDADFVAKMDALAYESQNLDAINFDFTVEI